jgi:glycosyltransferase involved in cell wall biosynthesis
MKILVIHQYYLRKNEGGGSRFNEMCKYWAENGYEITVIAGNVHYTTGNKDRKYRGKWTTREDDGQIDVIRCFVSSSYIRNFLGRFIGYFSFLLSSIYAGVFQTRNIDLIVSSSPPLSVGLTGLILSFFKRCPFIFEMRDLWPDSAVQSDVLKNKFLIRFSYWLEDISYRKASTIVVLTPAFKTYLIKKGIPEEKIVFIPNAADLALFKLGNKDNWVRKKNNLSEKFIILYTGAHGKANGLLQIMKAAELLRDYEDIVFMLVGDGMEKPKLKEYAKDHSLKNVIFIDTQSKNIIVDFVNASDVCIAVLKKLDVFKTVYPNKIFDYMACAKPIIIGIDGVARKLIMDAKCGLFIEPEDYNRLKDAVLFFYNNKEVCVKYGNNGRKFVEENFSRKEMAVRYLKLFEYLKKN